ncbi:PREDICTED: transcription initiation factor TFIID subunit 8-like [Camelina sativa]|uniref:Transcription initiation factor TFIID subunit 8 n=1 Tax=Camelina sativa TaxID=90675 RepID=A0ABM0TWC2_CAMSA|nr:PREDICTED: transcription initiation factor TFIID subunit 8-like [Camelina sativa]
MSGERAQEDLAASSSGCSESYEFSHAAAKAAVAQVCESVGYEHFKDPALESLAGFALQYILQLGKTAISFANLTGRSQCNVFDIILALEDLTGDGDDDGGGVSSESCSLGRSVKLKGIVDFVNSSEEMPFSQPLPRFPVAISKKKMMIPSFVEIGETPPGNHIPLWLPAFPDPHTYKETPMWIERASDPRGDKIEQARQRRKAERALLSLQRKLVCKISSGTRVWGDMDGVNEDEGELRSVPPSISGEKVESLNRDGLSVVEAFAPAMEAARDGFCSEVDTEWNKKKKPDALSKLRTEKKFLGEPLDLSLKMKGEDRPLSFVREEDRDDKRRRAEFILRQCMENPVDLNQL